MEKRIKDGLDRYEKQHTQTGSFLRAVLENDLMKAVDRADFDSYRDLYEICNYISNELPSTCHGSPEIVAKWIANEDE